MLCSRRIAHSYRCLIHINDSITVPSSNNYNLFLPTPYLFVKCLFAITPLFTFQDTEKVNTLSDALNNTDNQF